MYHLPLNVENVRLKLKFFNPCLHLGGGNTLAVRITNGRWEFPFFLSYWRKLETLENQGQSCIVLETRLLLSSPGHTILFFTTNSILYNTWRQVFVQSGRERKGAKGRKGEEGTLIVYDSMDGQGLKIRIRDKKLNSSLIMGLACWAPVGPGVLNLYSFYI